MQDAPDDNSAASPAAQLCTHCGVCCDGMLFTYFEFAPDEDVSVLKATGVRLEGGDPLKGCLPCTALRGTSCSIYEDRPRICRSFRCALLKRLDVGKVDLDSAIHTVETAKNMRSALMDDVNARFSLPGNLSLGEVVEAIDLAGMAKSEAGRRHNAGILVRWTALSSFIAKHFEGEKPSGESTGAQ